MHETEVEGFFFVAAYVMVFVYLACTALLKLLSTGRLASRWFVRGWLLKNMAALMLRWFVSRRHASRFSGAFGSL